MWKQHNGVILLSVIDKKLYELAHAFRDLWSLVMC